MMEIKKVCILGAGIMGGQIAQLMATAGYVVSMVDIKDSIAQKTLNGIKNNLQKFFVDKEKMTREEADKVLGRIEGTTDLKKALDGTQLVIECIPEEMELKQQMYQRMDELCAPETILASNTSSLSITAIGALAKRQDKVIGMHFFNPVAVMRLVEIIRGARTSDETYQVIKDLSLKLGKEIITVKDSAGFVVSRLFVVLSNEAVKLLEEGVATAEDIDKGCQLGLGHAMGPLKTQDLVDGVSVAMHCLDYMREQLGDSYKPQPLWRKMVWSGELGRNSGKGFYDHTKQ